MTNTLTISHTEAVQLHKELTVALADKNLDTLQIVSNSKDIHVVRLQQETATADEIHQMD